MANVTITQLPTAGPITGQELVPVVQNGQTVQTTTAAIAASPAQTQTFLTVNQEPTLANSRYVSAQTGIGITDNGAQSNLVFALNGASGSLEAAFNGMIAKTGSTTVAGRTLAASGAGLSVSNGDGVSGNPTFSLSGMAASLANINSVGILTTNAGTASVTTLQGTTDQIDVANGNALAGTPTFSIASNPTIPGTGGMRLPTGTTAQRTPNTNGNLRYNSELGIFEGYANGMWQTAMVGGNVTSVNISGGSTGLTTSGGPITTAGTITFAGVLNAASGGTGQSSYATGDLLYASAATTLTKLTLGTQGLVLKAGASAPEWGAVSGGTF